MPGAFAHQLQDLDRGVVVVQHLALRRLPDQLVERRSEVRRDRLHDVPLGRGRQRNAQVPLQAIEAVERQPAAVLQQPDHAAGRGVVLPSAGLGGRGRGEDLAAQVAAQLLQLVDRRRQRRLPGDPHQHARGLLVDGALTAGGTGVARGAATGAERRSARHPGTPRRRCARDPSRPPPSSDSSVFPRRQPTRSRPRRHAAQRPRASRSSAPPRLRSSPCAPRRTAAAAGGSRCSCLPPDRPRRRTTRRPRGPARRPSRRAIARRGAGLPPVASLSTSTSSGAFRILQPPADRGAASPAVSPGRRGIAIRAPVEQGRRDPARARRRPGQAGGPTGRQSAAAPVRVGSPAESRTAS